MVFAEQRVLGIKDSLSPSGSARAWLFVRLPTAPGGVVHEPIGLAFVMHGAAFVLSPRGVRSVYMHSFVECIIFLSLDL